MRVYISCNFAASSLLSSPTFQPRFANCKLHLSTNVTQFPWADKIKRTKIRKLNMPSSQITPQQTTQLCEQTRANSPLLCIKAGNMRNLEGTIPQPAKLRQPELGSFLTFRAPKVEPRASLFSNEQFRKLHKLGQLTQWLASVASYLRIFFGILRFHGRNWRNRVTKSLTLPQFWSS